MQEASFILPDLDNQGRNLAHVRKVLERALAEAFGGFSSWPQVGRYRCDNGHVMKEAGHRYVIAADWRDDAKRKTLVDIARNVAHMAGQESVYIGFPNEVHFVRP